MEHPPLTRLAMEASREGQAVGKAERKAKGLAEGQAVGQALLQMALRLTVLQPQQLASSGERRWIEVNQSRGRLSHQQFFGSCSKVNPCGSVAYRLPRRNVYRSPLCY